MILKAIDRRRQPALGVANELDAILLSSHVGPMRQHASGSGTAAREAPPPTEVQLNAGAVEAGQKAEPSVTPVGLHPQEASPGCFAGNHRF
jgi:hypothetical protein